MTKSADEAIAEAFGFTKDAQPRPAPEPDKPKPKSIAELLYPHLVKETKK